MMSWNGRCKFLLKQNSTANIAGRVFTSNVREAAERGILNGCDKGELVEQLECMKSLALAMSAGDVKLRPGGGGGPAMNKGSLLFDKLLEEE